MIYRLVDYYDVWGNEEDGWEVNDLARTDTEVEFDDDATEEDVFATLQDIGYLRADVEQKEITINWFEPEFIEFFETNTDMPLGRLEAIG